MWETNKIVGIYAWINLINAKYYVGRSNDMVGIGRRKSGRKKEHLYLLRKNQHFNQKLQKSYNKYGEENFVFMIIEEIREDSTLEQLVTLEQKYLDVAETEKDKCYNIVFVASGKEVTLQTRENLRKSQLGRKAGQNQKDILKKMQTERWNKMSQEEYTYLQKKKGCSTNASSKYVGVSFHKTRRKWRAYIIFDGKSKYKNVDTELEAAYMHDLMSVKFLPENRQVLNFPENKEKYSLEIKNFEFKRKFHSKYQHISFNIGKWKNKWCVWIRNNDIIRREFLTEQEALKFTMNETGKTEQELLRSNDKIFY